MRFVELTHHPMFCALLVVGLSVPATAGETRSHEAHEHGRGLLAVAAQGNELLIELEVPAVNVVGFEHEPSTDEQHRLVAEAVEAFKQADKLFVPSAAADCEAEKIEVALFEASHDEHAAEHDHSADQKDAHGEQEKGGDA